MSRKAFSQIELLLVVTILVIIFSLGAIVYSSFVRQDILKTEIYKIQSVVAEARMKTLSGYRLGGTSGYNFGVHFEEDSYTLFPGLTYNASHPRNQKYMLPENLMIEEVAWPSGNVVFAKISGEVINFDADLNYVVISDRNLFQRRKISVNLLGTMEAEKYE